MITEQMKELNVRPFFQREVHGLTKDVETFKEFYNSLPEAPAVKAGDKVKILKIHNSPAEVTESPNEPEKLTIARQRVKELHSVMLEYYNDGFANEAFAAQYIFTQLMQTSNQFLFSRHQLPNGETAVIPIELDYPMCKGFVQCTGDPGMIISTGDELEIDNIITLDDEEIENRYKLLELVEILGKQMAIDPEYSFGYSSNQVIQILDFAEMLGFIQAS